MAVNELGECEWFIWDLRRSGLIERSTLDQLVADYLKNHPRAEAPALAQHLIELGLLTPFQADRLLNGKGQGLVLGPYVLLDAIGSGSMGQVYKASSRNDDKLYAIKVLPRRSMWNVRLARRQVRAFQGFQHPAVVPFLDVGTAGGLHYLVWPLVEGRPLDRLVEEQGALPVNRTALIGLQIAQGLQLCHQNNVFHGLIKPSNIMIGPNNQVYILDFGIGSLLVENSDGESMVDTMSTANTLTSGLDCASPESILDPSNRTPAGDQYSLGCVLYFCLTGRMPFAEGSAVEKMMAHQTRQPVSIRQLVADVPAELEAIVLRMMAKKPEERFGTCEEVAEALEPFVGDLRQIVGGAPTAPASLSQSSGRLPGLGSRSSGQRPGLSSERALTATTSVARSPTPPAQPGLSASSPAAAPVTSSPSRLASVTAKGASPVLDGSAAPTPSAAGSAATASPAAARASGWLAPPANRSPLANSPAPPPSTVRPAPLLPGRSTLGLPVSPATAAAEPAPSSPAGSAAWAIEDEGQPANRFGPLGVVATAILLTILAYFGTMLILRQ
ncbi:MAG: protein kinase [Thermogemmata sp.]|nr:protein kinase [Thermogemmata sp.]